MQTKMRHNWSKFQKSALPISLNETQIPNAIFLFPQKSPIENTLLWSTYGWNPLAIKFYDQST